MPAEQLTLFDPAAMPVDQILEELSPDLRGDPGSWPATLAELVDVVADHFQSREKIDPEDAMAKAQDIILVIAHHLGGRAIYLPRDDKLKRAIRNAAIYRAFDGRNHHELARKTGLTTAMIYKIIAKQRKLREKYIHMALPFHK